jgi:ABC-type sugar transport system substrate-binding protein
MFRQRWGKQVAHNWGVIAAALVAMAVVLSACGSSDSDSGDKASSGAGKAGPKLAIPPISDADYKKISVDAFDYFIPKDQLPPVVSDTLALLNKPLTDAQLTKLSECQKVAVCELGKGPLSIGYLETAGNVPYRKLARAVTIATALRIPAIGKIYYTDANNNLQKALSDFRGMITQKVDIMTGIFDYGASMKPLARQATAQGLQVIPGYTNYIPGATPKEVSFQVGLDLCKYGKDYAATAIAAGPKTGGKAAFLTGLAGNPFGNGWQKCAKPALEAAGWKVVFNGATADTPQGEAKQAAAIISAGGVDAIMYDYTCENILGEFLRLKAKIPTIIVSSGTLGCIRAVQKAYQDGHQFGAYIANSDIWFGAPSIVAAVRKAQGAKTPFFQELPQKHIPVKDLFDAAQQVASVPNSGNLNTLLPPDVVEAAFQNG